ncbi:hypothetical protein [Mycobacterium avium]|uniref:hypothetical protein n=1 Tax=Mycobacterium avium TaxID=1764 RepID=UPI001140DDC6|nr:hypothetical protein [Mycobacterium avium]
MPKRLTAYAIQLFYEGSSDTEERRVLRAIYRYRAKHDQSRPRVGAASRLPPNGQSRRELPVLQILQELAPALFGAGAGLSDITLGADGESLAGFSVHHNISAQLASPSHRLRHIQHTIDSRVPGPWSANVDYIAGTVRFTRSQHDEPIHDRPEQNLSLDEHVEFERIMHEQSDSRAPAGSDDATVAVPGAAVSAGNADEVVHIISWWQWVLNWVLLKTPQALCGKHLPALNPDRPDPEGQSGTWCARCVEICDATT